MDPRFPAWTKTWALTDEYGEEWECGIPHPLPAIAKEAEDDRDHGGEGFELIVRGESLWASPGDVLLLQTYAGKVMSQGEYELRFGNLPKG